MKVGVADVDVIPSFRKIKFIDRMRQVIFHHLTYEINYEATTDELDYINPNDDDTNFDHTKKFEKIKQRDFSDSSNEK
jgi:hypothetical protein